MDSKHASSTKNGNFFNFTEQLTDIFPFILLETNVEGKILACNNQFETTLNYTQSDVCNGLMLHDIVAATNKPILDSLLTNFPEFSGTEFIELKLKRKDTSYLPVNMYFKPKYVDDKFNGLYCFFIDITENKRIENKYRHNQQRLRKIIDLVPHMIFLKDKSGKFLLSNKACADFYNTSPKKLVYENISSFHKNEQELARIQEEDRKVTENHINLEYEARLTDFKTNEQHIFQTTKVPYQEIGSDEVYSLGISVDITNQRKAETERNEANEKYKLLVEKGNDGILIVSENKIVFANQQAARLVGKTAQEIIGYPLSSFIPKAQLQIILEAFKRNLQERNVDEPYGVLLEKDDLSTLYLEARISSLNYEGKKSRLVFVRDVTKRQLAEIQSKHDRNLLEQAQKIAQLGSWEWDMVSNKLFCSEEVFKILGMDPSQTKSIDIEELVSFIPKLEKNRIYKGFLHSLKADKKFEIDFPIILKNGERKIIHSLSLIFVNAEDEPVSIVGAWIDITDRIKIEQLLKEAKLKAEESDKLKSAFLANMSHEIRTPMNAVLGFANLLKRNNLDENTRIEYIDHILQSGEGLIKLINDIVDISKIESNQLKIEKSPVRINELLEQMLNRYEELLLLKNKNNLILNLERALPDPDFTIITDPFRVQQIISNLLNNSIKFTHSGNIKFGYSIVNSELLFFVEDQGIGIPEDMKNEIFRRFGKLDDPERMNKSGTGLGLSIARSLLELLDGRIWLDTQYHQGARFYFTLPLEYGKKEMRSCPERSVNFTNDLSLNEKTILVAEDELLNYKLLETLLKKTGAKVLWAKNGIEAVQLAAENKIDLVFMDIKMPDMNGYEATRHIKRIDKNIPVIAQTAFAFSNERNYILQSGCDMYMTKPIDHKELYRALKTFLT